MITVTGAPLNPEWDADGFFGIQPPFIAFFNPFDTLNVFLAAFERPSVTFYYTRCVRKRKRGNASTPANRTWASAPVHFPFRSASRSAVYPTYYQKSRTVPTENGTVRHDFDEETDFSKLIHIPFYITAQAGLGTFFGPGPRPRDSGSRPALHDSTGRMGEPLLEEDVAKKKCLEWITSTRIATKEA